MVKGLALSLILPLGLGFGCGDDDDDDDDDDVVADAAANIDGGTPDATPAPDSPTPDAGPLMTDQCPATYGATGVSVTFEIAEGAVGFDYTGDGVPDNAIGASAGVRSVINNDFSNSLADGSLRTLAELREFDGLGTDDADLSLVLYGGIDSDSPRDTVDDFDGDEEYYYQHSWVFSLTCEPRAAVAATYTSGVMEVPETDLAFFVDSLGGFIDIKRARIQATIEADTSGYKTVDGTPAVVGGAITACSLQNGDAGIGFNALHALAGIFGVSIDVDVDGDGVEVITADPTNGVESCTDGDGTVIEDPECGCDPRIQDGFSITFHTDQVGAAILGPDPN